MHATAIRARTVTSVLAVAAASIAVMSYLVLPHGRARGHGVEPLLAGHRRTSLEPE